MFSPKQCDFNNHGMGGIHTQTAVVSLQSLVTTNAALTHWPSFTFYLYLPLLPV